MAECSLPETRVSATFNPGETALQQRWQTESLWDAARRQRLLWDHIPPELHARIEGAPFFFLATSRFSETSSSELSPTELSPSGSLSMVGGRSSSDSLASSSKLSGWH